MSADAKDTMTCWTLERIQREAYRRVALDAVAELRQRSYGMRDEDDDILTPLLSWNDLADFALEIERGEWPPTGEG